MEAGRFVLDLTLYLVTDSTQQDEKDFYKTIEAACRGGVTLVQYREKESSGKILFERAARVKEITDRYGIPLIIDDRLDIAMAVDAAGVHLGQEDLPISVARKILGPNKWIGATTKTVQQAKKAEEEGADYLGVGAIYPTTTKVKTILTKVSTLNEICHAVSLPVVAIGGLNASNCDILKGNGMQGIAVVSAIMKAQEPEEATRLLKEKVLYLKNTSL